MDAIGSHSAEAYASLTDMWDTGDYEDADTGEMPYVQGLG